MAGDYRRRDEIIGFVRGTAELTGGRALDIEQALLIELRDGLWSDIRAQPLDQAAFGALWD
jgi:hypothetical protein